MTKHDFVCLTFTNTLSTKRVAYLNANNKHVIHSTQKIWLEWVYSIWKVLEISNNSIVDQ